MAEDHELQCPMFYGGRQCVGVLQSRSALRTDMGTWQGIDWNHYTETFTCSACGKVVRRSYQWEEVS